MRDTAAMVTRFTRQQAEALMPAVRDRAAAIVALRADLADAQLALHRQADPPGGLAHVKSVEAHLQEALDWFAGNGIDVKGFAPLIIDFPSEIDGEPVLLCWLEGEQTLDWFHPATVGFMGRRRLP
jgi:hypothetical protein